MKKTILSGILLTLSMTALMGQSLELTTGDGKTIELPMTKVETEIDADHLYLKFICEEPQADFLKVKYKKPQWDVFSGEAVEFSFSPYGGWPGYRFRLNPSGKFFQSFYGSPKWTSRYITSDVEIQDKSWTAAVKIPFAALENDAFLDIGKTGKTPFLISSNWRANFLRHRRVTGKLEAFAWSSGNSLTESGYLKLPPDLLNEFRRIALKDLKIGAVDAATGKTTLSGIFVIPRESPAFAGTATVLLSEDREQKRLAEIPLKLEAGAEKTFSIPFTLQESGKRFSINLEIVNESGRLIKASRDLPVENPWVDF